MKKNNTKKVLSVFAVLAVSTTMAMTAIPFAACSDKSAENNKQVSNTKVTAIDTALGTTYSTASGKTYWVAPEVDYDAKDCDGSYEKPFNIVTFLNTGDIQPGDTILVKPGEYKLLQRIFTDISGEYNKYVTVRVATHEDNAGITDGKAVLDFSSMTFSGTNRGVSLKGDFIYWYGIDVCGAGDNGVYIAGNFNTIEYCEFYNNRDSGLQLGRAESVFTDIKDWPSYNLVKNCTSHNNYDNETYGENADGFAAKLTVGYGNVFDGCIAYRNSDDGWDLYAKSDSGNIGTVIMYNCVAYENGYLETTRDEYNSLFTTYDDTMFADNSDNPFKTRDGDGNGFKLGGSIMEGDVVMYNCLAFHNRMHGVTDNSNPGYLKVMDVTSYDNSAAISIDGRVVSEENHDLHGNIDVARQTYSYNGVINTLSVKSPIAKSLADDAYRGTVTNSILSVSEKSKSNIIKGSIDVDLKAGNKPYTEQVNALNAATMFKTLPVVLNGTEYTYNINGAYDALTIENKVCTLKDDRAHLVYRNTDGSLNMGDLLAKTEEAETIISGYLGEGVTAGSTLNKTNWDDYTHFYKKDFADATLAKEKAILKTISEALTLNTDESAVYQDFQVPVEMWEASVEWSSSDESIIKVGTEEDVSLSMTKFVDLIVTRPYDQDKKVTLTATIKYNGSSETKEFEVTVKKGDPSIGVIKVVTEDGTEINNGGTLIVDQFGKFKEPTIKVLNGLYPDAEKVLPDSLYKVEAKYEYAVNKIANKTEVHAFTPSKAGVYNITYTLTLGGDGKFKGQTASMTFTVYIASTAAQVDLTDAVVSVYKDGYTITGGLTSATGKIYAVSSATELTDINKSNIATYSGVQSYEFRANSINYNFTNANSSSYFVYYALANLNGDITSAGDNNSGIYKVKVNALNISSIDDFKTLAKNGKLDQEEPSQTLYLLTQNLNFADELFTVGSSSFTGVFNGNGHTISNLSTTSKGIFYKVCGGTIMNVKFNNLTINNGEEKVGLVVESTGGYFYNIAFTNVSVGTKDSRRVAALIGHIGGSSDGSTAVYDTFISQISIINDADHSIKSSNRGAGLIGYVQYYRANIAIENCYVHTDVFVEGKGEASGMVASWEDTASDTLTITNCYYSGLLKVNKSSTRAGGMLGYHKGGAGKLDIYGCLSLAKIGYDDVILEAPLKNASPIVGNYSSAATVSVRSCIALMEEANTSYEVSAYTLADIAKERLFGSSYLNFDMTKWEFKYKEGSTTELVAPYVTLLFLA